MGKVRTHHTASEPVLILSVLICRLKGKQKDWERARSSVSQKTPCWEGLASTHGKNDPLLLSCLWRHSSHSHCGKKNNPLRYNSIHKWPKKIFSSKAKWDHFYPYPSRQTQSRTHLCPLRCSCSHVSVFFFLLQQINMIVLAKYGLLVHFCCWSSWTLPFFRVAPNINGQLNCESMRRVLRPQHTNVCPSVWAYNPNPSLWCFLHRWQCFGHLSMLNPF